ncbi:uncharacterized protein HGUI_00859 [Hanseniaspora guilliermondii]|uniref:SPIN90/Ldb17 leucine-rich domain-containing protein n=1 Tax=Hanseniaspora guilliermondii TaxID=56406 RepID=A0A1L0B112_9ASCO|nr:uncharacterized protein HGUI_00859 [Hanseniaspora guilliermondii]
MSSSDTIQGFYDSNLNLDELLDDGSLYNIDFVIINVIDIIKGIISTDNTHNLQLIIDKLILLNKFNQNFLFANEKLLSIFIHLKFNFQIFSIVLKIFYREFQLLNTNAQYLISFKLSQPLLQVVFNMANYQILTECKEYTLLVNQMLSLSENHQFITNNFLITLCNVMKNDLNSEYTDNLIHLLLIINDIYCINLSSENPIPYLIDSNIINKVIMKFNRFEVIDDKILCLKMLNHLVCNNCLHIYLNDLLVFKDLLERDLIEVDRSQYEYRIIVLKVLYRILEYLKANGHKKLATTTIKNLNSIQLGEFSDFDNNKERLDIFKKLISDINKLDDRPAVPSRRKKV